MGSGYYESHFPISHDYANGQLDWTSKLQVGFGAFESEAQFSVFFFFHSAAAVYNRVMFQYHEVIKKINALMFD